MMLRLISGQNWSFGFNFDTALYFSGPVKLRKRKLRFNKSLQILDSKSSMAIGVQFSEFYTLNTWRSMLKPTSVTYSCIYDPVKHLR